MPSPDSVWAGALLERPEPELADHIRAVDMCEVFSPPRMGKEAVKHGLVVGDAMVLTTGWDFNLESHRRKAEAYVDEHEPLVTYELSHARLESSRCTTSHNPMQAQRLHGMPTHRYKHEK